MLIPPFDLQTAHLMFGLFSSHVQGTIIFVTKRIESHQEADSVWLQVPDGYVRERGILFGALGPPSMVPFDAAHHLPKSQVRHDAMISFKWQYAVMVITSAEVTFLAHVLNDVLIMTDTKGVY